MALEPRLWGTLPSELLYLVFARLSVAEIGQLRVLSKEWKRNIDCKHSEFNRVFDATQLKKFALISWNADDENRCELYDVQADKWHIFEVESVPDYIPVIAPSAADGGLFCSPWEWRTVEEDLRMFVSNPLTQRHRELPPLLPPLLSTGAGDSDVGVRMVQLTTDKKTKEYKVHVVCSMKTGGMDHLFAQVYDSHVDGWSLVDTGEGRIIGWCNSFFLENSNEIACVFNCADGNLHRFNPSNIAPGLTGNRVQLLNDHLFVLHKEAPTSSTNRVQGGESNSGKYCISEFHLPGKTFAWVKLRVHYCDPSIHGSPREEGDEEEDLTLLACNGFLLVHNDEYNRVWLYNLSTRAWRKLPDLCVSFFNNLVMCEMNWSALP